LKKKKFEIGCREIEKSGDAVMNLISILPALIHSIVNSIPIKIKKKKFEIGCREIEKSGDAVVNSISILI